VCVQWKKVLSAHSENVFAHGQQRSGGENDLPPSGVAAAEEWRLMKKVANKERSQAIKNWCWAAAAFYRQCMRPGEM